MSEMEKRELEAMLEKIQKLPEPAKAYVEGVAAGMAIMAEKKNEKE